MPRGLFRRGYIAFLYRFLNGFVEDNPNRPRKRKVRPPKKVRKPKSPLIRSPGPTFRVRVKTVPNEVKLSTNFKVGEWWKLVGGTWIKHFDQFAQITNPYKSIVHTQDYKNPGPPYRTGGPFTSVKVNLLPLRITGLGNYKSNTTLNFGDGSFFREYRGGFTSPSFSGVDFTDSQYADQKFLIGDVSGFVPSLAAYYGAVDKRLRPKLNHANLGQSFAEIREIPSMLQGTAKDFRDYWKFVGGSSSSKRMSPKGASDSFLSASFGWAPFIRDILDVCNVVVNYDTFVRDTTNRNGKWDHRSAVLEETDDITVISSGTGQKVQPVSVFFDDMMVPGATWTKRFQYTQHLIRRVWAAGDYKFYRPSFDMSRSDYDSGWNQVRRLSTILGTDVSPALLWKITPWTWLADWFFNIGNVIETATAAGQDGVVSKNVFLMYSWHKELALLQEFNFNSRPCSFEFRRIVDSKQRGHAQTPYSFGLQPGNLSSMQWSILGALGISKFT